MKLATFIRDGSPRVGLVHASDTAVFDLVLATQRSGADPDPFRSMLALIDSGDRALDAARDLFDRHRDEQSFSSSIRETELLAPLPEPRQMRDAMSFPLHILQGMRGSMLQLAREGGDLAEVARLQGQPLGELPAVYRERPIYYITNRFSVAGPGAVVRWPRYSRLMDYELELGCVIKGRASNIAVGNARNHIFGFTIYNDFSARDAQRIEMQGRLGPAKGKSFDGGNVIGPWIVTPDEIGNPYDLRMSARVNGEIRCATTSAGMLHSFEDIIAYVSRDETLMPGEFIGSGTVGNGCGLETGRFLEDGDTVELAIENIGTLANVVRRQA
jgi:2-keto-4-pentenoate hydratase/2-oxohepta-3-ene-1,7-dioic acid hydratase in catechol pathway